MGYRHYNCHVEYVRENWVWPSFRDLLNAENCCGCLRCRNRTLHRADCERRAKLFQSEEEKEKQKRLRQQQKQQQKLEELANAPDFKRIPNPNIFQKLFDWITG